MIEYICNDCREPCEIVEEVYEYSATHCAPSGGVHHTGYYLSNCCDAEFGIDEQTEEQNQ